MVGLNSDDSVRRLKGPNRPILSESDRLTSISLDRNSARRRALLYSGRV
jgi:hypothetical protein